jgi:hypothetical protein
MKIRLIEIKMIESSINKLMETNLPVKTAYRLSKLLKDVSSELQTLEENRVRLVRKYADVKEDTPEQEVKVPKDKVEPFQNEFNELLQTEVEIKFDPVSISDLEEVRLTPIDILRLENIISFEEDKIVEAAPVLVKT